MKKLILLSLCFGAGVGLANADGCDADDPMFNEGLAKNLIKQWNNSLLNAKTGTAQELKTSAQEVVKANYAPHAVLLPTLSNVIRMDTPQLVDYFEHFLGKQPHLDAGSPYDTAVYSSCGLGVYNGDYDFIAKGQPIMHARFTFVYEYLDQPTVAGQKPGWYIVSHHSSLQPPSQPEHNSHNESTPLAKINFEF